MYIRAKCLQVGTQYRLIRKDQLRNNRQEQKTKNILSLEEMAGTSSVPQNRGGGGARNMAAASFSLWVGDVAWVGSPNSVNGRVLPGYK